jgi:hypothetical protein
MTAPELRAGALRTGAAAVAALAVGGGLLGGLPGALGVLGGGAVALGNFGWLCRDAERLAAALEGPGPARWRLAPALLRQLGALGALGALLAGGLAHPAAVAAGLAVLPPVLLVQGLRAGAGPAPGGGASRS